MENEDKFHLILTLWVTVSRLHVGGIFISI